MRSITIGLLGLGTVGQALVQLIQESYPDIQITRALVRQTDRPRKVLVPLTINPDDILYDPTIDIVVDVMGGQQPAFKWLSTALQRDKDVVTANKEVMAYRGPQLLELAHQHHRELLYEASVAGGIPLLDALSHHLALVPATRIEGVLNGTCNFILSLMEQGDNYPKALAEAQRMGYAEQDPSADVLGFDTARKLVLLSRLGFHAEVAAEFPAVRGIDGVTASDVGRLASFGCGMRLVGSAALQANRLLLSVTPTVFRKGHPFLGLQGPQNAVQVVTAAGTFWFQGPGAGGLATATSILSDILRIRRSVPDREANVATQYPIARFEHPIICFSQDPDRALPLALSGELRRTEHYAILSSRLSLTDEDLWGLRQFEWGEEEEPTFR